MLLIDWATGVVPGMVITELWDKMGQSKEQQKANFEKGAQKLPVGFVATPEDVSPVVDFGRGKGLSDCDADESTTDCGSVSLLCKSGLCQWQPDYD